MRKFTPNEISVLSDGNISVKLSQNKYAIIDKDGYDKIKKYRWCARKHHKTFYAVNGKTQILMHQVIFPVPKGFETDHKNRNGLDNRTDNLRPATTSQNGFNKSLCSRNVTGITGVSFNIKKRKWQARICVSGTPIFLGLFLCFKKAVNARKIAEKKMFKEYAPS